MNFNFTHKNEYVLNVNLIDEAIRLYGIDAKILVTDKNNVDIEVFGDWSSVKTDNKNIFDVHLLPSNADDLDRGNYMFSDFGLNIQDSCEVFISAKEVSKYNLDMHTMLSSLVIFPSNKVMEITNVEWQVPGINNLWAYSDAKSAYKLTLRAYEFKLHDFEGNMNNSDLVNTLETESKEDTEIQYENYDVLDGYFETLLKEKEDLQYEAEVKDLNSVKVYEEPNLDKREFKSVVNTEEKDPFGW